MIKLIYITKTVKVRMAEMLKTLLPWVGYVRVAPSGLVTMKKHWYSLKREKAHVLELMLKEIPIRIFQRAKNLKIVPSSDTKSEEALMIMLQLLARDHEWKILDYLWNQYSKYCVVPIITSTPKRTIIRQYNTSRSLPVFTFVSPKTMYGLNVLIKIGANVKKEISKKGKQKLSDVVRKINKRHSRFKQHSIWPRLRLTA